MTSIAPKRTDQRLEALHNRLAANSLSGHWESRARPQPLKPFLWSWDVIRSCLEESGEVVELGSANDAAARRTVQLVNPALTAEKATTRTFQVSIQLVKPGETAECHRHTFNAMRFVVQSKGMYTTAEGEQMIMEPGDLLIQPGWAWHDHTNRTDEPAIWLDLLDHPLTRYLDSMFSEVYAEGAAQPVTKSDGYSRRRFGAVRPRTDASENQKVAFSYKWKDVRPALLELAAGKDNDDLYDGVLLEYAHPVTGGPILPTIGAWVQMLRPGESTRPHRHTSCAVYHAVEGQGVTALGRSDEKQLSWTQRDCFFVPPWTWHQHRNLSSRESAILFSITDRPTIQALGFYREEKG
ncbi:MAG: cupin domain-containing protein [Deltaproteobacteria bacterium]|nr:cupin domain-containing protein [Deltaproteobacteria bacterium]